MRVMGKPPGESQEDEVETLLLCHRVEKSALSKKTVVEMRQRCHQPKVTHEVKPPERREWR